MQGRSREKIGCLTGSPSIIIVGSGTTSTYIYNIASGTYTTGAPRPFSGDHHAAEVINNDLWLFGGLNGKRRAVTRICAIAALMVIPC